MTPVIWIVNTSSTLLLRAMGFDPTLRTAAMTTDEVLEIVTSHKGFGLGERELVTEVFEAREHTLAELMRHRSDMHAFESGRSIAEDLIEELVGEIWDEYDDEERRTRLSLHESRILDGSTILQDFAVRTGIHLPEGPYETVAGWMLARLGRIVTVRLSKTAVHGPGE